MGTNAPIDTKVEEAIRAQQIPPLCEAVRMLDSSSPRTSLVKGALQASVQQMMDGTYKKVWTHDRRKKAKRKAEREITPKAFQVTSVAVVNNNALQSSYQEAMARLARSQPPSEITKHPVQTARWMEGCDPSLNEWLLMHGTSAAAAEAIQHHGFDLARAEPTGMLGPAFYFTECPTKADEYASPENDGDDRVLIICRVLGGNVHYTEEVRPDPEALKAMLLAGKQHSILNNREVTRKTFKEFALMSPEHVLPECIVRYRQIV